MAITVQVAPGLSMTFHESHALWVVVPETYTNTLCGLGGDFSMDTRDDFSGSDSMWLSEANSLTGIQPLCAHQTRQPYARPSVACWAPKIGPIGPEVRTWIPRSMWRTASVTSVPRGGSRESLCAVLGSYTQECQQGSLPMQP